MNKKVFKFRKIGKNSYYAPGDKRMGISNILIFPVKEGAQIELDFDQNDEDPEYLHIKRKYGHNISLDDLEVS